MGTPEVAATALLQIHSEGIKQNKWEVVACVTQPPRPFGRKRTLRPSPVHTTSDSLSIPVLTPEKATDKDFLDDLAEIKPDLCITAAYGCYLPKRFLSTPPLGTLNIHPSLLPLYRGASPVQRSLENGDPKIGVSVLYTVKAMDAGPVLRRVEVEDDGEKGTSVVLGELFEIGTEALTGVMGDVLEGKVGWEDAETQREEDATKAAMIDVGEGEIKVWDVEAREAKDRIRAFDVWPGCHIWVRIEGEEGERKLKIGKGRVLEGKWAEGEDGAGNAKVGKWGAKVRCKGDTVLELLRVQPEGKKMMDAKSWVNGLGGRGFEVVEKK